MTAANSGVDADREALQFHLGLIQGVIARMSSASATTKGWVLPVVTVAYGYALTKNAESIALLGGVAAAFFAVLDANYLRQERSYRALYNAVISGDPPVPRYSLDLPSSPFGGFKSKIDRVIPLSREVWCSWSVGWFYGPLTLAGFMVIARILCI